METPQLGDKNSSSMDVARKRKQNFFWRTHHIGNPA